MHSDDDNLFQSMDLHLSQGTCTESEAIESFEPKLIGARLRNPNKVKLL
jgi:hypothetical protein